MIHAVRGIGQKIEAVENVRFACIVPSHENGQGLEVIKLHLFEAFEVLNGTFPKEQVCRIHFALLYSRLLNLPTFREEVLAG